ncbi:MAG: hypothetical protein CMM93_06900 [Rickettsiales bacterium]|nr:hypothetical protein [Rickettsiales bacterium]
MSKKELNYDSHIKKKISEKHGKKFVAGTVFDRKLNIVFEPQTFVETKINDKEELPEKRYNYVDGTIVYPRMCRGKLALGSTNSWNIANMRDAYEKTYGDFFAETLRAVKLIDGLSEGYAVLFSNPGIHVTSNEHSIVVFGEEIKRYTATGLDPDFQTSSDSKSFITFENGHGVVYQDETLSQLSELFYKNKYVYYNKDPERVKKNMVKAWKNQSFDFESYLNDSMSEILKEFDN